MGLTAQPRALVDDGAQLIEAKFLVFIDHHLTCLTEEVADEHHCVDMWALLVDCGQDLLDLL